MERTSACSSTVRVADSCGPAAAPSAPPRSRDTRRSPQTPRTDARRPRRPDARREAGQREPAHDRQTTSPHAHHTPSVHAPRTTLGLGTGQRRLTEPGPPRHMRPEPPQPTGPGRARYRDSGQPQQMGPEQRWQRKTRRPELRNGPAREDPNSRTRSEMNSPRRREPRLGNSWLLTCRCQEPAYPMCPHWGLARGTRRPPSNPLPSAPLRGWRAGDCAPPEPLAGAR